MSLKRSLFISLSVLIFFGCVNTQESKTPLAPKPKKFDVNEPCAKNDQSCFLKKANHFMKLCDDYNSDIKNCYLAAKHEEVYLSKFNKEWFDRRNNNGRPSIYYLYHISCEAGISEACDSIKRLFLNQCIKAKSGGDRCYKDGPVIKVSRGVSHGTRVRIDNKECNLKLEKAKDINSCSSIGEYYAMKKQYDKALGVFKRSCTSDDKTGCGGLVCIAHMRARDGKLKEANKLFKMACDSSEISPGESDGEAYEGCEFKTPKPWKNKKAYKNFLKSQQERMIEKAKICEKEWKRVW